MTVFKLQEQYKNPGGGFPEFLKRLPDPKCCLSCLQSLFLQKVSWWTKKGKQARKQNDGTCNQARKGVSGKIPNFAHIDSMVKKDKNAKEQTDGRDGPVM